MILNAAILLFVAIQLMGAQHSQWASIVHNGDGNGLRILPPNCRSLSSFEDSAAEEKELGIINNRRIIQTLKRIEGDDLPLVMKRLLVERTSGEFCLIYQQRDLLPL